MSTNYVPVLDKHDTITTIDDGDAHQALTYTLPLQQLADNNLFVATTYAKFVNVVGTVLILTTPSNWDDVEVLGMSGSALPAIAGMMEPTSRRYIKRIINYGATPISINNNDLSTAAPYRILTNLGRDVELLQGMSATLVYDQGSFFWRLVELSPNETLVRAAEVRATYHTFQAPTTFIEKIDLTGIEIDTLGDAPDWRFSGYYWERLANTGTAGTMVFFLNKHLPQLAYINRIRVRVKPAASRSGTNKMKASLEAVADGGIPVTLLGPIYDAGGTSDQYIVLEPTIPGDAPPASTEEASYRVYVTNGIGGATGDRIYSIEVTYTVERVGPR